MYDILGTPRIMNRMDAAGALLAASSRKRLTRTPLAIRTLAALARSVLSAILPDGSRFDSHRDVQLPELPTAARELEADPNASTSLAARNIVSMLHCVLGRSIAILAAAVTLNGAVHAQTAGWSSDPQALALVKASLDTASERAMSELYATALRAEIARSAKYPNSREARQLQPVGRVGLGIELDRGGILVDARITSRSAYMLLDMEALRSVRNARYPSFPAEAFAGEGSHRFTMTLEYAPNGR